MLCFKLCQSSKQKEIYLVYHLMILRFGNKIIMWSVIDVQQLDMNPGVAKKLVGQ